MSVLIQCSKHIRTAYSLSRQRISNSLISNANSHVVPRRTLQQEPSNGNTPFCNANILPNRSFFSSAIQNSQVNKIDGSIKKLDNDLRRYGRISRREIEEILNEISASRTVTPTQALMVLRCCGNLVPDELPEIRTALVQKIWKTINDIGVPLDISHYNTLLKVYLENEFQFSPTEFLEDLQKKGVAPNRVTYQHLISSYCQNGDIDGASRILEFMRDKQLPINRIVFNALVLGHSQNGDMESAEGVLNVMKKSNLEPLSDTYTLLSSGYAKKGDISKVLSLLEVCESKEIHLNNKEYLDIVYSLAVNGHSDQIDQVISKLEKSPGYNQDAINCIYKLVIAGHEATAFKLFETMTKPLKPDGTTPPIGRFLIAHLTKVNSSLDHVIGLCTKLVSEGTNPKAFEIATEMALKNGSVDIALGMFDYLKKNEQPIRQHYFWPLFIAKNEQNDLKGIKDILSIMIGEYELNPNIDTLRYYILPPMFKNGLNGIQIINELQLLGVPSGTSTHALVLYLLSQKDIRQAADIAATNRAFYLPFLIRRPLVNAYLAENDLTSLIVILQQICNGLSRYSLVTAPNLVKQEGYKETARTEEQIIEMREFISQVVNDIVIKIKDNAGAVQILQELFEKMYGKGLGINARAVEQVQNYLQGKLTFEVSTLLENLSDSNLTPKVGLSVKPGGYTFSNVTESTLEKIIEQGESAGESKNGSKRQLLNLYCKNKNLEKATELKNKLIAEGFNVPDGSMVLLLDLYLNHNKLVEAKEIYQTLMNNNSNFILDKYKVIKLAEAIAKTESIENAINFLSSVKQLDDNNEFTSFQHANACWKLLNTVADSGNVEYVQKMFDLIVNNNYIAVSNILLGPLIKVHLNKDDVKGALEKFEWCCKTYRCTPWKNELALKFIKTEDATSLQVLTDLSTTVHGEVNSLYDLMTAFIESGKIKQARKILETPGLRPRQDRIDTACAKYGSDGAVENIKNLLEVTKDISAFDRSKIFNELLDIYSKDNKVEEAMALWTQMQEEDTQPSDYFMWNLSELLKKNNLEVPFTVKKPKEKVVSPVPSDVKNSLIVQFKSSIENNDIDQAFALRKKLYSRSIYIQPGVESELIELLTRENRLDEAFKLAKNMLEGGRPVTRSIFNFLVGKLSDSGDIASLEYFNEKVAKSVSSRLGLNSKIFKAHQSNGNINDLLVRLETSIDENIDNESKLSEIIKNIPGGNLVNFLNDDNSIIPTIERLHKKVSAHGHKLFANSLWSHYMLNKDFEKAKILATEFENDKFIQYRQLLSEIRSNHNIELGYKLIEILPTFKTMNQNTNIGLVYSAIIDSYVSQENVNEAVKVLDTALEKLSLEDVNSSALYRLKKTLEASGQTFKYEILSNSSKTKRKDPEIHSDSSDSSDDEKVAKV